MHYCTLMPLDFQDVKTIKEKSYPKFKQKGNNSYNKTVLVGEK